MVCWKTGLIDVPYKVKEPLTSEAEIREIIDGVHAAQVTKILDYIDPLCRAWIERSTFLTMATYGADGSVDVSPKGDPAGFVRVVDDKTLAIPDRPGNHRFDSFRNILQTGRIGLVFLVPNRNEVVRVNGRAEIARDMDLRESLAINGRVPDFAVVVHVEEAFYHCGKAIIRSALWKPDQAGPTDGLPTYGEALYAHATIDTSLEYLEERLKNNDENRLYDE